MSLRGYAPRSMRNAASASLPRRSAPRARFSLLCAASILLAAPLTSCGDDETGPAAAPPSGSLGVGEACAATEPCRPGLGCADGSCAPNGTSELGARCVIGPECESAQCVGGRCVLGSLGERGATCSNDGDCAASLRCQLTGLASQCVEAGTSDLGVSCELNDDCFSGLSCVNAVCVTSSPEAPFGGSPFDGVDCAAADDSGPPRAYFEVPGAADANEHDFFRLPFPNDARKTSDDHLDLSGFPEPGRGPLSADPVAAFIEQMQSSGGWGSDPAVLFRFSTPLDAASIEANRIHFVDLDPELDDGERDQVGDWYYSAERNAYVCANWLAVMRPKGHPLTPGHVYAVYLEAGLSAKSGAALEASSNLRSVLAEEAPDDEALHAVHGRYAPFRDYLRTREIEPENILAATVITAAPVRDPLAWLANAIAQADPPETHDWVKCGDGAESPCPDHDPERGRDCGASNDSYDEYQALVDLPIFQRGEAPYLTPEAGGDLDPEGPLRNESVCLSLTVPKGEMPAAGWPLVVFAHGTGGGYRDHVAPQIAERLANATLPNGEAVPLAVLGIDQVEHGPRRGDSTLDSNLLFFNFTNPKAALGNPLQAAADQLSLAHLAENFDVQVGDDAIKVDPDNVFFFGHSQGSTAGSLMLPYSKVYKAAVLSSSAASVREVLLGQKSPFDAGAKLPALLGDVSLSNAEAARFHPALTLISSWLAPADPLNFAGALVASPIEDYPRHHVFQTYGVDDSFGPSAALETFAIAAGLPLVDDRKRGLEELPALPREAPPLAGNADGVTCGVRQYAPGMGIDGNFVVFADDTANADMVRFFATAAHDGTPLIGE